MVEIEKEARRGILKGLIQRAKAERARLQGESRVLDRMHTFWQKSTDLLAKGAELNSEQIKGLQADLSEMDRMIPTATETSSEPAKTTSPTTTTPAPMPSRDAATLTEVAQQVHDDNADEVQEAGQP